MMADITQTELSIQARISHTTVRCLEEGDPKSPPERSMRSSGRIYEAARWSRLDASTLRVHRDALFTPSSLVEDP